MFKRIKLINLVFLMLAQLRHCVFYTTYPALIVHSKSVKAYFSYFSYPAITYNIQKMRNEEKLCQLYKITSLSQTRKWTSWIFNAPAHIHKLFLLSGYLCFPASCPQFVFTGSCPQFVEALNTSWGQRPGPENKYLY